MAAADYFLKIAGVEGASIDDKNKKEIKLESWSWGQSNSADGGGGVGKVVMHDLNFTTKDGKASALLFLKCATGKPIGDATLTCRLAAGEQKPFQKIKLTNVYVTSFNTGGGDGDISTADQITLNFNKIEYSKAPVNEKGEVGQMVTHSYDLAQQKAE